MIFVVLFYSSIPFIHNLQLSYLIVHSLALFTKTRIIFKYNLNKLNECGIIYKMSKTYLILV